MSSIQKERYGNAEPMPRVTLTAEDYRRLSTLANAAFERMPDAASALGDELDRAHVLAQGRQPDRIVRMGSAVEFRDNTSGKVQTVMLVYPHQADIEQGKVSVLTPVGTALIGLAAGSSITWRTRGGEFKRLTVLQVREQEAV